MSNILSPTITAPKPDIDPSIPNEYHRHWEVFDEEAAKRFPPARNEDHTITLKEGAPDVLDCKIYRQTAAEEEATKYSSENISTKDTLPPLTPPTLHPFSIVRKRTEASDPLWTIASSIPGRCETYTPSP
jgi:hypothetical protein